MTEHEWFTMIAPARMLSWLRERTTERKLRLFAAACCRQISHLCSTQRFHDALTAAERFADAVTNEDRSQFKRMRSLARSGYPATTEASLASVVLCKSGFRAATNAWRIAADIVNKPSVVSVDEWAAQSELLRDIVGNPFRPVIFSRRWRTSTVLLLAKQMYESRDFSAMPILADALQDASCDNDDILNHCRSESLHVRGCWVVDLVLGKS